MVDLTNSWAIVLAAGAARRYGASKLLVDIDGAPLIHRTVTLVRRAGFAGVIVVLGFEADLVRSALEPMPVQFVVNEGYVDGMGGSVAIGAAALAERCERAMVFLGDQPVEPEIVRAIVAAQDRSGLPIAAPVFRGARRHPVAFMAELFPELRTLRGHAGARAIIDADPSRVTLVEFRSAVPPDLDVPAEREELLRSLRERDLLD
jgi:molybdenum cofactor cytidylyltransferase